MFTHLHGMVHMQVRLAANSCVSKDITEPGDYGGFPAVRIFFQAHSFI